MHPVRAFKTTDGALYETEELASRHELVEGLSRWARAKGWNPNTKAFRTFAEALLEDAPALTALMAHYVKALPPAQREALEQGSGATQQLEGSAARLVLVE